MRILLCSDRFRPGRSASLCGLLALGGLLIGAQEHSSAAGAEPDSAAQVLRIDQPAVRLGSVAFRHPSGVTSVRQTTDGKTILSIDRGKKLRFWSATDGQLLATLDGLSGPLSRVITVDGKDRVAAATSAGTVAIIDPAARRILSETKTSGGSVRSLAISPDGKLVAGGNNDDLLHIWQTADGSLLQTIPAHEGWVSAVAFLPDSQRLVSGGQDFRARLWEARTGKQLHEYTRHAEWIWSLDVSPDGKWLATGSWDSTIGLWDLETGRLAHRLQGHHRRLWSVSFSPDSQLLASGGDGNRLHLWQIPSGKPHLPQPVEHAWWVNDVHFSADGKTVLTGGENGTVERFHSSSGRPAFDRPGHSGGVLSAAVLPDGAGCLTGGTDGTLRTWLLDGTLKSTTRLGIGAVRAIAVLADAQTLVAAGGDSGKLALVDPATGIVRHPALAHADAVTSLAVLDDHRIASASRDGTVRLWDARTGRLINRFETGQGWVLDLAVRDQAPSLFTAGQNGQVQLWHLDQLQQPAAKWTAHQNWVRRLALSPDGTQLLTAGLDEVASLWQVKQPSASEQLRSFDWKRQEKNVVTQSDLSAAVFIGEQTVAIAGEDRTIRLWNTSDGSLQAELTSHMGRVNQLLMLPGNRLLSVSDDGTGLIWQLK